MKQFIRRWRETRARRARVASVLAKFSEVLFWLLVVGPFAFHEQMNPLRWAAIATTLFGAAAGSYWYSRNKTRTGGQPE